MYYIKYAGVVDADSGAETLFLISKTAIDKYFDLNEEVEIKILGNEKREIFSLNQETIKNIVIMPHRYKDMTIYYDWLDTQAGTLGRVIEHSQKGKR